MTDRSRQRVGRAIGIAIVAAAIYLSLAVFLSLRTYPRTDDAAVRANVVSIAAKVDGYLSKVAVVDNASVKQGDLLFVIDQRPYEIALANAGANLELVELQIRESQAAIMAAEAQIVAARAEAEYARSYLERLEPLRSRQFVSPDAVDKAVRNKRIAESSVLQAEADLELKRNALGLMGNVNVRRASAQASVEAAKLNLSAAAFPELKSLMFERNWNQSPPAGSHRYNESAASRPVTLFYDGRVGNIPNLVAIIDDARVSQQANDTLWSRDSPGGSNGYYGELSTDSTSTSHSVLTTGGILGRDVLDTRCRVGAIELALLFANWGGTAPDIINDGSINGYDLTRVLDCWGGCSE